MLYKKYHRNFVKQFKIRATVYLGANFVVIGEPFINKDGILIKVMDSYKSSMLMFVVFISGRLRNAI